MISTSFREFEPPYIFEKKDSFIVDENSLQEFNVALENKITCGKNAAGEVDVHKKIHMKKIAKKTARVEESYDYGSCSVSPTQYDNTNCQSSANGDFNRASTVSLLP